MSALPPIADMCSATQHVCFVPIADIRTTRTAGSRVKLPMASPQSSSQCDLSTPIYVFSIQKTASSQGKRGIPGRHGTGNTLTNEISRGAFQYDFFSRTDGRTTDLSDVRRLDAACLDCSKQTG